jgi:hypothetical protein
LQGTNSKHMARRLTIRKIATHQAIGKEIEERCLDVVDIYNMIIGEDHKDYPYEYRAFDIKNYNVVIFLYCTGIDVKIEIPIEILTHHKYIQKVTKLLEEKYKVAE